MKYRVLDDAAVSQVLHHDALEQCRRDARVPDRIRIHDDDGTASANSEAGRLPSLHSCRAEQQPLAMEQLGKQGIQLPPTPVGRTEASRADEDVA